MYSKIHNIKIEGIASAVSCKWDSLRQLNQENDKTIEQFIRKTSVEGRYSASQRQTTSDFCYTAAAALLEEKKIEKEKIGVLVFVTQTPDYRIPATACVLQLRLGLSRNLVAFDVNLGCSGYVNGLNIVSSLMESSQAEYGLLLAGDTSAREFKRDDKFKTGHTAAWLFGDAGTATLLHRTMTEGLEFSIATDGSGYETIFAPYGGWRNPDCRERWSNNSCMNDIDVFNFATNEAPSQINDYMIHKGKVPADYDCLVLHQANLMILKRIAKKTGFPVEKMLVSMNHFANTSSASIPLTLVNEYGESSDDTVISALCCGFGVGLSWGTVEMRINKRDILPLLHTDEYFKDGYNLADIEQQED